MAISSLSSAVGSICRGLNHNPSASSHLTKLITSHVDQIFFKDLSDFQMNLTRKRTVSPIQKPIYDWLIPLILKERAREQDELGRTLVHAAKNRDVELIRKLLVKKPSEVLSAQHYGELYAWSVMHQLTAPMSSFEMSQEAQEHAIALLAQENCDFHVMFQINRLASISDRCLSQVLGWSLVHDNKPLLAFLEKKDISSRIYGETLIWLNQEKAVPYTQAECLTKSILNKDLSRCFSGKEVGKAYGWAMLNHHRYSLEIFDRWMSSSYHLQRIFLIML